VKPIPSNKLKKKKKNHSEKVAHIAHGSLYSSVIRVNFFPVCGVFHLQLVRVLF
jgi:hypothetical protein